IRCTAQDLLLRAHQDLNGLRNTILSYYLSGSMPRKLRLTNHAVPSLSSNRIETRLPFPLPSPAPAIIPSSPSAFPGTSAVPPSENIDLRPPEPGGERQAHLPADPWTLDSERFPLLVSLGRNLTWAAKQGQFDPVIGRSKEIEEVIDILGKRRTNNPC